MPFSRRPIQHKIPKVHISSSKLPIYKTEIKKLIEKGTIIECTHKKTQFLSSYFLIRKPNGEYRFILNLKRLNRFITNHHFKMEDYRSALKLITRNCFMSKLDLKDAYFLLSINKEHRKYLRFSFKRKIYEFTCLPFGLNVAPRIFTKLLKPVVRELRQKGHFLVIYLDDILIFGKTFSECTRTTKSTIELLSSLGFILNLEKSILYPTQNITYLGFTFNSVIMQLGLPVEKVDRILRGD